MDQADGNDATYVSMSRLRVPEARSDELVEAFRGRVGLVDSAEGFLGLQVWRSDRDATEVTMVSFWRDRECFSRYMRSEEHRVSHDRIDPDLQASLRLERLEHHRTFDVVAR